MQITELHIWFKFGSILRVAFFLIIQKTINKRMVNSMQIKYRQSSIITLLPISLLPWMNQSFTWEQLE